MMIRYIEIRAWPGEPTPKSKRIKSPFKAPVNPTRLLADELRRISATRATVAGYWRMSDLKRDGSIYADARPAEPGVVVEFERHGQRLRFSGDRYLSWFDNLHAIARSLEALRMIDRYGVTSGRQYEAFLALPAGDAGVHVMSQDDAALLVADGDEIVAAAVLASAPVAQVMIRNAMTKAHPDTGGSVEAFQKVQQAKALLEVLHAPKTAPEETAEVHA